MIESESDMGKQSTAVTETTSAASRSFTDNKIISLNRCGFVYRPQIYNTQYDQIKVTVPARSSLEMKSSIEQYEITAQYEAVFEIVQPAKKMRKIGEESDDIDSKPRMS